MNLQNIDFEKYAQQMSLNEGGKIFSPKHWIDGIADRLQRDGRPYGDKLPWEKTHDIMRFRPGELTIWAGMSGHRKSMLLGWVCCNFARNFNSTVAIASLEMQPEETILRMARQCSGRPPTIDDVGDFLSWADSRMAIYDEVDKVKWNRIIGFVYYCAKELGIAHIVIDSLTKCGISPKDGEGEKEFIDRLQWAAKTLGCHIHLVCHVRKPQAAGEEYVPSKFDVRGASEMTDLCDNVIIIWKDKKREQILDKADQFGKTHLDAKDIEYLDKSCDQKFIIAKQRHGSGEGSVRLWFDRPSLQFVAHEGKRHQLQPTKRRQHEFKAYKHCDKIVLESDGNVWRQESDTRGENKAIQRAEPSNKSYARRRWRRPDNTRFEGWSAD